MRSNKRRLRAVLRTKVRVRQMLTFRRLAVFSFAIAIVTTCLLIYFNMGTPKQAAAGVNVTMSFQFPELIGGTAGQVGAVYKFSNVVPGVDAHIAITNLYKGAGLSDIDHYSAGYEEAWQPFVITVANDSSWIDWRITFKKAGTLNDTALNKVCICAVDVDGDGVGLKETVGAVSPDYIAMYYESNLTSVTADGWNLVISPIDNIPNIDTTRKQAMVQMNFLYSSGFSYRTGAISTYPAGDIRQTCLYFKTFFDPDYLPVELVTFKGVPVNQNTVMLTWQTASESNNDYFIIERSVDGAHFDSVGMQTGAGTVQLSTNYNFEDTGAHPGINYYRLKQKDFNAAVKYSTVVSVELSMTGKQLEVISSDPNPFAGAVTLSYFSNQNSVASYSVCNSSGRIVLKGEAEVHEGKNQLNLPEIGDLQNGVYFLQLTEGAVASNIFKIMSVK